jgi:hypothetical protein
LRSPPPPLQTKNNNNNNFVCTCLCTIIHYTQHTSQI